MKTALIICWAIFIILCVILLWSFMMRVDESRRRNSKRHRNRLRKNQVHQMMELCRRRLRNEKDFNGM